MKKIFTLITLLFVMFSAKAEITNLQTYVNGTDVEFYWQCDTTMSKIYEVGILETAQYNWISYVGAYPSAFEVSDGLWGCSTDVVLAYGYNYTDYEGTASADYFTKEDWDASVDSTAAGLTLKPGEYIVYVEGYDGSYDETTETLAYAFVEIETGTEAGINDIIEIRNKAIKFLGRDGNMYIMNNNKMYNIYGGSVK